MYSRPAASRSGTEPPTSTTPAAAAAADSAAALGAASALGTAPVTALLSSSAYAGKDALSAPWRGGSAARSMAGHAHSVCVCRTIRTVPHLGQHNQLRPRGGGVAHGRRCSRDVGRLVCSRRQLAQRHLDGRGRRRRRRRLRGQARPQRQRQRRHDGVRRARSAGQATRCRPQGREQGGAAAASCCRREQGGDARAHPQRRSMRRECWRTAFAYVAAVFAPSDSGYGQNDSVNNTACVYLQAAASLLDGAPSTWGDMRKRCVLPGSKLHFANAPPTRQKRYLSRGRRHAPPSRAGIPRASFCAVSHGPSARARRRRRRPRLRLARQVRRTAAAAAGAPGRLFVGRGPLHAVARWPQAHGACCCAAGAPSAAPRSRSRSQVLVEYDEKDVDRFISLADALEARSRGDATAGMGSLRSPVPAQHAQEAFPDVQVEGNVAGVRPRCVAHGRCWQAQLAHAPAPLGRALLRSPRKTGGPFSAASARDTCPHERSWWTACAACCQGSKLQLASGGEHEARARRNE